LDIIYTRTTIQALVENAKKLLVTGTSSNGTKMNDVSTITCREVYTKEKNGHTDRHASGASE